MAPQLIPAGVLVTLPKLPRLTESTKLDGGTTAPPPPPPPPPGSATKVAVALLSAFKTTVQLSALPAHAPPHIEKALPEFGLAVSVSVLPGA